MKVYSLRTLVFTTLLCTKFAHAQIQTYSFVDLGAYNLPSSINNNNQIVGRGPGPGAWLWNNGSMQSIGFQGAATVINDIGYIGGNSPTSSPDNRAATLWKDPSSHGQWLWDFGMVQGLNNLNQAVGWSALGGIHAVYWGGSSAEPLAALPNASESRASGINDAAQIVGQTTFSGTGFTHATYWFNGTSADLNIPGDNYSSALGISDLGIIVGASGIHAVKWINGTANILPSTNFVNASATAINGNGSLIGGFGYLQGGYHALIWANSEPIDLNKINSGRPESLNLKRVTSINNSGWIVGVGVDSIGIEHGFLLSPVPEPRSGALILVGLLGIRAALRNSKNLAQSHN